jgi:predicted dithiol-disulfide oxidoreductase (DUF899 family)
MDPSQPVVDRSTWLTARRELLDVEKAATRQLDEVAARRRSLPWVEVDEAYAFDTHDGTKTLAELFDGRSQLVVYHFMMGPDWDEGCPTCSFWADNYDGTSTHLAARDTTLVAISRAPLSAIDAYHRRMGWTFEWVSSAPSSFNMDYGVSFPDGYRDGATYNFAPVADPPEEAHGVSVFATDADGNVYHTYSAYGRGVDLFNGAYQLLDLTPKGRDEDGLPWSMAWLRRHDSYDTD